MNEPGIARSIIGSIALIGAMLWTLDTIRNRINGIQHFGRWIGGGNVTFIGQISFCVFLLSFGACALFNSKIWIALAFASWTVGYLSQNIANRLHQNEEDEMRARNSQNHVGIFDVEPPNDIESISGKTLDLYDAGACTYLGRVSKSDIATLIKVTAGYEDGPNDIYWLPESMDWVVEIHDSLTQSDFTAEFKFLLEDAFEHRDYLVLRWMPKSKRTNRSLHSGRPVNSSIF